MMRRKRRRGGGAVTDEKREILGQSPIARLLLCPYAAAIHAYLTR